MRRSRAGCRSSGRGPLRSLRHWMIGAGLAVLLPAAATAQGCTGEAGPEPASILVTRSARVERTAKPRQTRI